MINKLNILEYETIDSTNEEAYRLINKGSLKTPCMITADQQIDGKGRLGRKWISPKGKNIYITLIFNKFLQPQDEHLLIMFFSLSITKIFQMDYNLETFIKWPNDIIINKKKIAGILTEIYKDKYVIGIGINLNSDFSNTEIEKTATSLFKETNRIIDKHIFLSKYIKIIDDTWFLFNNKGELKKRWDKMIFGINLNITIDINSKKMSGTFLGTNENGKLLIKNSDGKINIIKSVDRLRFS